MDLKKIRRLSNINRFSGYFKVREQSVAEHIHFVAIIALDISNRFYPELKSEVMEYAILHDVLESSTMNPDFNYLFKKLISNYDEIEMKASVHLGFNENPEIIEHPIVNSIIKFADMLEVLYFSDEEIKLGNSTFEDIYRETYKRLLDSDFEHKHYYISEFRKVEPKELPELR